jgi:hypothetical protein
MPELYVRNPKEELFEEVLRVRDEADRARIIAADSIDGLRAVVRHNGTVPGLVQLYSTFSADPEHSAHEFFVDRYAHLRATLADAVRARQSAGTFAPDADPDTIATLLIALSDGLQVQSQYDLPADPANLFAHLLNLLSTPKRDS